MLGIVLTLLLAPAQAEPSSARPDRVLGEVVSVDAARQRLAVKADAGGEIVVTLADGVAPMRAKPGATSLEGAAPMALADVAAGDRVLARGALSADRAQLTARQLVVMSAGDVTSRRELEQADWRRRGALGIVTAVDAAKGEVTLRLGRWSEAGSLVVGTIGGKTLVRRYPAGSVRFADARASRLEEVAVGDELRALGDRDAAGVLQAEQVVFGSFEVVAGEVAALDAAAGTLKLRLDDPPRIVTVAVGPDARLRQLPPEMAARFGRRGSAAEAAGERPRFGRGGGNPEDLLQRMPAISLADVKSGDHVLVSSTKAAQGSRLDAIVMVTGLPAPAAGRSRGGRSREGDVPPELMDFGLSLP